VPLGHAAAGDAVAHATAPINTADATAVTSIFTPPSLSGGSGAGATCRLRARRSVSVVRGGGGVISLVHDRGNHD
jgi:hypothetical protein